MSDNKCLIVILSTSYFLLLIFLIIAYCLIGLIERIEMMLSGKIWVLKAGSIVDIYGTPLSFLLLMI